MTKIIEWVKNNVFTRVAKQKKDIINTTSEKEQANSVQISLDNWKK